MKNLLWPTELWNELLMPFEFQGGFPVTLHTKKNHITNLKSALKMVLISLVFHAGSFHVKIVLQEVNNMILVLKNHVNFLN